MKGKNVPRKTLTEVVKASNINNNIGSYNFSTTITPNSKDGEIGADGHAVAEKATGTLYIWFNETNHVKDWIVNVVAKPVNAMFFGLGREGGLPFERVHLGWAAVYNKIRPIVEQLPRDPEFPIKRIVVAGHSLGGAIAAYAAVSLKKLYPGMDVALYQIAGPRTGNIFFRMFVKKLIPNSWAFRYGGDIVPKQPRIWAGLLLRCIYFRVGKRVQLSKNDWWRDPFGEWGADHQLKGYRYELARLSAEKELEEESEDD